MHTDLSLGLHDPGVVSEWNKITDVWFDRMEMFSRIYRGDGVMERKVAVP